MHSHTSARRRPRRPAPRSAAAAATAVAAARRPGAGGRGGRACCRTAEAALGPIGVLVNNASVFERDEWHDATRASWDRHLEPNLRAPFVLMQDFARRLPAAAEGVVVNMLDQRVWSLTQHFVSYTVVQGRAVGADPDHGAGAGAAHPGERHRPRPGAAQRAPDRGAVARQSASVPLGHGTSPDEVARAVIAILALPAMTGQMIALDGGQHLQWGAARTGPPDDE